MNRAPRQASEPVSFYAGGTPIFRPIASAAAAPTTRDTSARPGAAPRTGPRKIRRNPNVSFFGRRSRRARLLRRPADTVGRLKVGYHDQVAKERGGRPSRGPPPEQRQ